MDYYGYIYLTTNNYNGKKYIGKRKGYYDPEYLGSGLLLNRSIDKYGRSSFSNILLDYCYSSTELDDTECYYIDHYDAVSSDEYYNIRKGGTGGNSYGKYNTFYGRTHTEEVRRRIGESTRNSFKDPERLKAHKQMLSDYTMSSINSDKAKDTKVKKYGSVTGAMMTPEVRERAGKSIRYYKSDKLRYDGKVFIGRKVLIKYLRDNGYPTITNRFIREVLALDTIPKYQGLYNKITLVDNEYILSTNEEVVLNYETSK